MIKINFTLIFYTSVFLICNCASINYSNVEKQDENYEYSLSEKIFYNKSFNKFILKEGFQGNVIIIGDVKIGKTKAEAIELNNIKCYNLHEKEINVSKDFRKIYSSYFNENSFCFIND